jgi:hypothetical protein
VAELADARDLELQAVLSGKNKCVVVLLLRK